jgi:hypothetical protein
MASVKVKVTQKLKDLALEVQNGAFKGPLKSIATDILGMPCTVPSGSHLINPMQPMTRCFLETSRRYAKQPRTAV